MFTVYR